MNSKKDMDNLISVIVPVYNCEKYLDRCLKSILNQTYKKLQIILVNDGSTDGSKEICNTYALRDQRISVVHQLNSGVGKARNVGLDVAVGEYIAFVDSDDWIHSQYFETLMHYLEKYDADVVMCRNLKTVKFVEEEVIDLEGLSSRYLSRNEIISDQIIKTRIWARLYKASLLDEVQFPEKVNLGEDTCFNLKAVLSQEDCKCVIIEIPMYYYFVAKNDSLVHAANYYDLLLVGTWYLEEAKLFAEKKSIYRIFVNEACKSFLACRYLTMFNENKKTAQMECNKYIKQCLKYMKGIHERELLKYLILYILPWVYRLYRIFTDKTMIAWEKAQIVNMKKNT